MCFVNLKILIKISSLTQDLEFYLCVVVFSKIINLLAVTITHRSIPIQLKMSNVTSKMLIKETSTKIYHSYINFLTYKTRVIIIQSIL